jgi:hypothetical protein
MTINDIAKWARDNSVSALEAVEYWDERAAIRQHDGGATQEDAEAGAFADLQRALGNGWLTQAVQP